MGSMPMGGILRLSINFARYARFHHTRPGVIYTLRHSYRSIASAIVSNIRMSQECLFLQKRFHRYTLLVKEYSRKPDNRQKERKIWSTVHWVEQVGMYRQSALERGALVETPGGQRMIEPRWRRLTRLLTWVLISLIRQMCMAMVTRSG